MKQKQTAAEETILFQLVDDVLMLQVKHVGSETGGGGGGSLLIYSEKLSPLRVIN